MKALTVIQPYADMIAKGEKIIENRKWATDYRGPLAIHAGKNRTWLDEDDLRDRPSMAFGAIVAVAELRGCIRLEDLPLEYRGRDDAEGPWCWILQRVEPLAAPISVNGAQGLWDWADAR